MKSQDELSEGNRAAVESIFRLQIPDAVWEKHGVAMSYITHEYIAVFKKTYETITGYIVSAGGSVKELKEH